MKLKIKKIFRERGQFEKYNEFNKDMVEVMCPYCSKDFKIEE